MVKFLKKRGLLRTLHMNKVDTPLYGYTEELLWVNAHDPLEVTPVQWDGGTRGQVEIQAK